MKGRDREGAAAEQRMEAKTKELKVVRSELERCKDEIMRLKLDAGENRARSDREKELLKMSVDNRNLQKEVLDLKNTLDDMKFKNKKLQDMKVNHDVERDNLNLKENIITLEGKLATINIDLRQQQEEVEKQKRMVAQKEFEAVEKLVEKDRELKNTNIKLAEVQDYARELAESLERWADMDGKGQLLINKWETQTATSSALPNLPYNKKE